MGLRNTRDPRDALMVEKVSTLQPLITQPQDDRVVLDQEVADNYVPVLLLDDEFLLEAVEHIDPHHFWGRV